MSQARNRGPLVAAWILGVATVAIGLIGMRVSTGFPEPMPWSDYPGIYPDPVADLMTTRAAWDGFGAQRTMSEFGAHYPDIPDYYWPLHNPRPPAALLVQAPYLAMSATTALHWGGLFMIGSLLIVLIAAAITSQLPAWRVLACGPLIALSPQLLFQYEWAKFGTGMIPAVAIGLALVRMGRLRGAGLAFGIAAALQLWPAILLVGLVRIGAMRAAVQGSIAGAALTAGGLLLPGVTVSGTIDTIRTAGEFFLGSFANASLAGVAAWFGLAEGPAMTLAIVVGAGVWIWGLTRAQSTFWVIAWSLMAGLLISPLSWGLYWLTAIPVVFWLVSQTERFDRVLAIAVLIAWASLIAGYGVVVAGIIVVVLLKRQAPLEVDLAPNQPGLPSRGANKGV